MPLVYIPPPVPSQARDCGCGCGDTQSRLTSADRGYLGQTTWPAWQIYPGVDPYRQQWAYDAYGRLIPIAGLQQCRY